MQQAVLALMTFVWLQVYCGAGQQLMAALVLGMHTNVWPNVSGQQ